MGINTPLYLVIFVSSFAGSLSVQIFSFKAQQSHGSQPQGELSRNILDFPRSARPSLVLHFLRAPVKLQDSLWKLSWCFLPSEIFHQAFRLSITWPQSSVSTFLSKHFCLPGKTKPKTKHASLHPYPLGGQTKVQVLGEKCLLPSL